MAILNEIVAKYARRMTRAGTRIACCGPDRYEREMRDYHDAWDTAPARMKVIYNDRAAAEAAAREMTERLGFPLQSAYTCRRSKHGHQHLTSTPIREGNHSRRP